MSTNTGSRIYRIKDVIRVAIVVGLDLILVAGVVAAIAGHCLENEATATEVGHSLKNEAAVTEVVDDAQHLCRGLVPEINDLPGDLSDTIAHRGLALGLADKTTVLTYSGDCGGCVVHFEVVLITE